MAISRGFVRKARCKFDRTRFVDIRITDMGASDALWWDSRLGPKHSQIRSRADRFWAWSVLLPMCHLVGGDDEAAYSSKMSAQLEREALIDSSPPAVAAQKRRASKR
jgi:hypothetical protein